jgi:hypothetical protein
MRLLSTLYLYLFLTGTFYLFPTVGIGDECRWLSAAEKTNFGKVGRDGKTGRNGEPGRNSDNLTIFADGSPLTVNLVGQTGNNGEDGEIGQAADCPELPANQNRNLKGADGGNGGNGGDGGVGGDGGALTIYATDISFLRQVTVNASGGAGGQPGRGGVGGEGCQCGQNYWSNQICRGRPGDRDYNCTTQEFRCQNGLIGRNGSAGRVGQNGRKGKLTLIKLDRPLTPDQPSVSVPLQELKDRGAILSRNKWQTQKDAASLFAPSSVIEDEYLVLEERIEKSFLLIWNAPQAFDDFAKRRITLNLDEQNNIQPALSDEIWLQSSTQQKGNVTELIVYNAILAEDVTRLKSEGISGSGGSLELFIQDNASQSSLVATEFKIKYRVSRFGSEFTTPATGNYVTRYEGDVPSELVTFDGNRFTIAVGQLPIPPESLKAGVSIEIELTALRSFANYSKQQRLTIQEVIKSSRRR